MKKKISITRPLYWFCILPFFYILANILGNTLSNIFYKFRAHVLFLRSRANIDLINIIYHFILAFILLPCYLKVSKQHFIKPNRLSKDNTFSITLRCVSIVLCVTIIYYYIRFVLYEGFYVLRRSIELSELFKPLKSQFIFSPASWQSKFYFFFAVICAPITEEIVHRRVIYDSMKEQSNSVVVAILLSSILFTVLHISNGYSIIELTHVCFGGIVLAYMYEKTNRLLPSIIIHAIVNGFLYIETRLAASYYVFWLHILVMVFCLLVLFISVFAFLIKKCRGVKMASSKLSAETPTEVETANNILTSTQATPDGLEDDTKA